MRYLNDVSSLSHALELNMEEIRAILSPPIMKGVINHVDEKRMDQNNSGQSS